MNQEVTLKALKTAHAQAEMGVRLLVNVVHKRFPETGEKTLIETQNRLEEVYRNANEEERLNLIGEWAMIMQDGEQWEQTGLEALSEKAYKLKAMRDFLAGNVRLLETQEKERVRAKESKKKKIKEKMAKQSRAKNRK
jgi:ABC-type phosphonate transport system ATPase subunit